MAVQQPSGSGEPQTDAEGLRERAASRRAAQRRTEDAAERFLSTSQASEGRNGMVAAKMFGEAAHEYEQAAREEEQHRAALATVAGEQIIGAITAMFDAVGLKTPRTVAQAVLRGEQVSSEMKIVARCELGLADRVEGLGALSTGDDGDDGRAVRADARDEPDDGDTDEDERDPVDEGADDAEAGTGPVSAEELASAEREIREGFPGAAADEEWVQRSLEQWREREESRRAREAADEALVPTEQQLETYLRTYVDPRTAEAMWRKDRREGRRLDRGSVAGRPA